MSLIRWLILRDQIGCRPGPLSFSFSSCLPFGWQKSACSHFSTKKRSRCDDDGENSKLRVDWFRLQQTSWSSWCLIGWPASSIPPSFVISVLTRSINSEKGFVSQPHRQPRFGPLIMLQIRLLWENVEQLIVDKYCDVEGIDITTLRDDLLFVWWSWRIYSLTCWK